MQSRARTVTLFILALSVSAMAHPQSTKALDDKASQSLQAATVFGQIMDTPDQAIPKELLDQAECIAVFPSVLKAGVTAGWRGVGSCRTVDGWSAPAYFTLGGATIESQIGAQSTDFVMLFMTHGMKNLVANDFAVGRDVSAAAGPVGRHARASTDVKLTQVLAYSRSKGLFAGLELKGAVITPHKEDMHDVYGTGVTAEQVLKNSRRSAPSEVRAFPITLGWFSRNGTE